MLSDSQRFKGSVFCKVLCDTLRRYGDEKALHEILQHLKSSMDNVQKNQKVETLDSLTKILWFIPKK